MDASSGGTLPLIDFLSRRLREAGGGTLPLIDFFSSLLMCSCLAAAFGIAGVLRGDIASYVFSSLVVV